MSYSQPIQHTSYELDPLAEASVQTESETDFELWESRHLKRNVGKKKKISWVLEK